MAIDRDRFISRPPGRQEAAQVDTVPGICRGCGEPIRINGDGVRGRKRACCGRRCDARHCWHTVRAGKAVAA